MLNLKALALTATLAASAFIASPAAKAGQINCGQLRGAGQVCSKWVGSMSGGDAYSVTYTHYDGQEDMTVVCDGRNIIDWSSNGTLSQDQAAWVATEFCALPDAN